MYAHSQHIQICQLPTLNVAYTYIQINVFLLLK